MGNVIDCEQVDGTRRLAGRATLEGDMIEFRGSDTRTRVPYRDIVDLTVLEGILSITTARGTLHLDMGEQAEKWAERLRHPPTRMQKLGIKPGDHVLQMGTFPADFQAELGEVPSDHPEWILYMAETTADLHRLPPLGTARGLWIIYPRKQVAEKDVLQAGRSAGMTDTKVMRFSDTHTGLKFVARKKKSSA